jgi:hypothetical protein
MPIAEVFETTQDSQANTPGYRLLKKINDIWRSKRTFRRKRLIPNIKEMPAKARPLPQIMNLTVNASKSLLHNSRLPELSLSSFVTPLKIKLVDPKLSTLYMFDATLEAGNINLKGLSYPRNGKQDILAVLGYFNKDITSELPNYTNFNGSTCDKLQQIFRASKLSKVVLRLIIEYLKAQCKDALVVKFDVEAIAGNYN